MKSGLAYDPYRVLRDEHPEWQLVRSEPRAGVFGLTRWSDRTVTLRPGMTAVHERSVLAHEVCHVERGPAIRYLREREERVCDEIAARRLIPMQALLDALWLVDGVESRAAELGVTPRMFQVRMESLTEGECRVIRSWAAECAENPAEANLEPLRGIPA